jgi:hypothetical protein
MKHEVIFADETTDRTNIGERGRETARDRVLTEIFRWLPAVTFFAIYMANQNTLFMTYAIAFTLWPCLKATAISRGTGGGRTRPVGPKPQLRLRRT